MIQIDTYIFKSSCCAVNSAKGEWGKGKDIQLHFKLLDFVRKSILYAKITLSQKNLFQN